ncbi:hypothetical protein BHE74_00042511 [Ensete ventricosum]|nr:hypothetical protein BHE74_00042511 [Ensete ventricosum]RZS01265.1 hypothetical protein BHM03_00031078 [Ensete ventricosum]
MRWELVGSSLELRQRYGEDRYELARRLPKEDRGTRRRECQRLPDRRRFGLHPKKIGSGRGVPHRRLWSGCRPVGAEPLKL